MMSGVWISSQWMNFNANLGPWIFQAPPRPRSFSPASKGFVGSSYGCCLSVSPMLDSYIHKPPSVYAKLATIKQRGGYWEGSRSNQLMGNVFRTFSRLHWVWTARPRHYPNDEPWLMRNTHSQQLRTVTNGQWWFIVINKQLPFNNEVYGRASEESKLLPLMALLCSNPEMPRSIIWPTTKQGKGRNMQVEWYPNLSMHFPVLFPKKFRWR